MGQAQPPTWRLLKERAEITKVGALKVACSKIPLLGGPSNILFRGILRFPKAFFGRARARGGRFWNRRRRTSEKLPPFPKDGNKKNKKRRVAGKKQGKFYVYDLFRQSKRFALKLFLPGGEGTPKV